MNRQATVLTTLLTALAAVAALTLVGTPAQAARGGDQRACVTYGEFARVKAGMTKRAAFRLLDVRGKREVLTRSGGLRSEMRSWRSCPGDRLSRVTVNFDDYTHGSYRRGGAMRASYKDHTVFW
jgi:hypothetical protein